MGEIGVDGKLSKVEFRNDSAPECAIATLRQVGYTDDWYAYDVMSKEIDTVETFNTVTHLTRKLEALADRIDRQQMAAMMAERNPVRTLRYLYDTVLG